MPPEETWEQYAARMEAERARRHRREMEMTTPLQLGPVASTLCFARLNGVSLIDFIHLLEAITGLILALARPSLVAAIIYKFRHKWPLLLTADIEMSPFVDRSHYGAPG
jgi:hypothetical protein